MSYIVYGETGEYEDRKTWPVSSYRHKISADTHAELANRWTKERGLDFDTYPSVDIEHGEKNPFDRNMQVAYTGTEYHVEQADDGDVVALGQLEAELWPA